MNEIRSIKAAKLEVRSKTDRPTVYGRGITFDSISRDMGGFKERFSRSGKYTLDPSFRLLWDHSTSTPLGSYRSGLKLTRKSDGIYYECPLPATYLASDVATLIRDGISDEVSFSFSIDNDNGDKWEVQPDGTVLRTVLSATIFEISILGGAAAYASNTVDIRSALRNAPGEIRDKVLREADPPEDDDIEMCQHADDERTGIACDTCERPVVDRSCGCEDDSVRSWTCNDCGLPVDDTDSADSEDVEGLEDRQRKAAALLLRITQSA